MCNSVDTLLMVYAGTLRNTELSSCGKQMRFSPPMMKQATRCPSTYVLDSSALWSAAESIGTCGIDDATGGGVSSASSGDDSVPGSFFTEANDDEDEDREVASVAESTVLGPCRLLMALFWYVLSTFLRCGVYGCGSLDTSMAPLGSFSIIMRRLT